MLGSSRAAVLTPELGTSSTTVTWCYTEGQQGPLGSRNRSGSTDIQQVARGDRTERHPFEYGSHRLDDLLTDVSPGLAV
jgi:hypothetical protein